MEIGLAPPPSPATATGTQATTNNNEQRWRTLGAKVVGGKEGEADGSGKGRVEDPGRERFREHSLAKLDAEEKLDAGGGSAEPGRGAQLLAPRIGHVLVVLAESREANQRPNLRPKDGGSSFTVGVGEGMYTIEGRVSRESISP